MRRRTSTEKTDVVVFGGGVAGVATAIGLRNRGIEVTVVERSTSADAGEHGEVLVSEAREPLTQLGLWAPFDRMPKAPVLGRLSAWGSSRVDTVDHLFNPHGHSWVVSRSALRSTLQLHALQCGVRLLTGAIVRRCHPSTDGGWLTEAYQANQACVLESAVLISATGRARSPAEAPGDERTVLDRLVAITATLERPHSWDKGDHRPLIESIPDGWWYSVLLPDGRALCALFSDADLVRTQTRSCGGGYAALLVKQAMEAVHTAGRLGESLIEISKPRVFAAGTMVQSVASGACKVNVGDACFSLDPLSGQGLHAALDGACRAASAVTEFLCGDVSALRNYEWDVQERFRSQWALRRRYYLLERRWAMAPFWRRRHEAGELSAR